jgi:hypothetical protein
MEIIRRIGNQVIAKKKAEVMASLSEKGGDIEKKDFQGRDLLSLLIKSNLASDIPESARMTDEELLARVSFAFHMPLTSFGYTLPQRLCHF